MLSFASRPWTRLIEDELWYLPVNALAGLGLVLVVMLRREGSRETCDTGGMPIRSCRYWNPAWFLGSMDRLASNQVDAKPYSAQSDFVEKGDTHLRRGRSVFCSHGFLALTRGSWLVVEA